MQILAILALCAATAFAEYSQTDDVVILTASNFDETLTANEFVLVEFYAPWCGHCKSLEPHYKKAATALKAQGVVLGAMDATEHGAVSGRFGVKGYPTLKWFRNGVAGEYTGGRTEDTIISWVSKRLGPSSKALATADDVASFIASNKLAVVGFFPAGSADSLATFESVAQAFDDVVFGYSSDLAVGATHGLENGDGVVLFKPFDEKKNLLESFDATSLQEFVENNRFPTLLTFSMDVVPRIFQSKTGTSALLFTKDATFPGLQEVANQFKGKVVVAQADDKEQRLLEHIGVKAADFPKFFILDTKNQATKYRLEGEVNEQTIISFINDYFAGKVEQFVKSEDIPASNDEPVKVIVSKAFKQQVLQSNKHVFLEIYAPWCGHCKKLAPIWDQLAEHYSDVEDVVLGKMDGTLNEVAGINIRGFPTIVYFAPGAKNGAAGKTYDGGREFDDIKKFINEKAHIHDDEEKDEL